MTRISLQEAYQKYQASRATAIACGWQETFLDEIRDRAYTFAQVNHYVQRQLGASRNMTLAIINYTHACAHLRWAEAIVFRCPDSYPHLES